MLLIGFKYKLNLETRFIKDVRYKHLICKVEGGLVKIFVRLVRFLMITNVGRDFSPRTISFVWPSLHFKSNNYQPFFTIVKDNYPSSLAKNITLIGSNGRVSNIFLQAFMLFNQKTRANGFPLIPTFLILGR